jgi:hypothetical protein
MPTKKKNSGSSWKLKLFVIVIILIFAGSYLTIFGSSLISKSTLPSASSFNSEEWMSFIPQNVTEFEFLNYNVTGIANLLQTNVSLYLIDINYNLSVFDVHYEVDIQASTSAVKVLMVNSTVASFITSAYSALNQTSFTYDNVTMYLINGSDTPQQAWIAVYNGAVLYSVGNTTGQAAIAQVMDATNNQFFSSDPYKVGFLTVSNQGQYFALYYANNFDPSLQIDWAMVSFINNVNPTEYQVFHFPTSAIANSEYSQVEHMYFVNSTSIHIANNFIFGSIG